MGKLIFFSTITPDADAKAWMAFTLARRAVEAGLESEIFLSGAATGLARRQVRDRIEGRQAEALKVVLDAQVPISLSPG